MPNRRLVPSRIQQDLPNACQGNNTCESQSGSQYFLARFIQIPYQSAACVFYERLLPTKAGFMEYHSYRLAQSKKLEKIGKRDASYVDLMKHVSRVILTSGCCTCETLSCTEQFARHCFQQFLVPSSIRTCRRLNRAGAYNSRLYASIEVWVGDTNAYIPRICN